MFASLKSVDFSFDTEVRWFSDIPTFVHVMTSLNLLGKESGYQEISVAFHFLALRLISLIPKQVTARSRWISSCSRIFSLLSAQALQQAA